MIGNKKQLGQFFTKNSDYILGGLDKYVKNKRVIDPFAGSGVAGEQAVKAGRKTALIEKSEKAVEKHIKPRVKKALIEASAVVEAEVVDESNALAQIKTLSNMSKEKDKRGVVVVKVKDGKGILYATDPDTFSVRRFEVTTEKKNGLYNLGNEKRTAEEYLGMLEELFDSKYIQSVVVDVDEFKKQIKFASTPTVAKVIGEDKFPNLEIIVDNKKLYLASISKTAKGRVELGDINMENRNYTINPKLLLDILKNQKGEIKINFPKSETKAISVANGLIMPIERDRSIDIDKHIRFKKKALTEMNNRIDSVGKRLGQFINPEYVKFKLEANFKGNDVLGYYVDQVITFFDNPSGKTISHEAFHAVFDLFVEPRHQLEILDEVKAMAKKPNMTDSEAEEQIANWFEIYARNSEDISIAGKLKQFFDDIINAIKRMFVDNKSRTEELFADIRTGKFAQKGLLPYAPRGALSARKFKWANIRLGHLHNLILKKEKALEEAFNDGKKQKADSLRKEIKQLKRQRNLARPKYKMRDTDLSADELANKLKGTKVVDENGNPQVTYHGSAREFEEFSLDFIGEQGFTEGKGFYFTDNKELATGYTKDGGTLYSVYLDVKKPMTLNQRKITDEQLRSVFKEIVKIDKEALANYGADITFIGEEASIEMALDIIKSNESDIDIIADLGNSGILPNQDINNI